MNWFFLKIWRIHAMREILSKYVMETETNFFAIANRDGPSAACFVNQRMRFGLGSSKLNIRNSSGQCNV